MPSFYPYLISSLPMLHFGMRPPFSSEKFLLRCKELIPEKDFQVLETQAIKKEWLDFDTMLRNELVKARAEHKKLDAAKYLRPDGYAGQSIYHIVLAAQRNPSPLEGEKILDEQRWKYLEELSFGHYFDLDYLIIYAYKLRILERWERIFSADTSRLLGEVMRS